MYDYLMVKSQLNINDSTSKTSWHSIASSGGSVIVALDTQTNVGTTVGYHVMINQRDYNVNVTSIAISGERYWRTQVDSTWVGVDNRQELLVPIEIYGVKFS